MREKKRGTFSNIRHRNLRGLDLVCINANFNIQNVILKRVKTIRGRIDANLTVKKNRKMRNENFSKASSTPQAVQPAQPVS